MTSQRAEQLVGKTFKAGAMALLRETDAAPGKAQADTAERCSVIGTAF
jgi:hypothetical protein